MHNDETVWQYCGTKFCSFKAPFLDQTLCRNVYNVDGACSRLTCPLANGYYGTIIETKGVCYLYLKTIERAHTPRKLWERIPLSNDQEEALKFIELRMTNIYPEHQIEYCKKRYLRMQEVLGRLRILAELPEKNYQHETRSIMRRERTRELAALRAARIAESVENELLNRLKQGQYGDIYNYPVKEFHKKAVRVGGDEALEDDEEGEDEEGESLLAEGAEGATEDEREGDDDDDYELYGEVEDEDMLSTGDMEDLVAN